MSNENGKKDDNEKPRAGLLPGLALLEVAKVLTEGAKKYEAHNWRKGLKNSRLLDAAQRHLLKIQSGEAIDPDFGIHHAAHAVCELLFLLENIAMERTDLDDLYKKDVFKYFELGTDNMQMGQNIYKPCLICNRHPLVCKC